MISENRADQKALKNTGSGSAVPSKRSLVAARTGSCAR